MVAVAHLSPAQHHRPLVVRLAPAPAPRRLPAPAPGRVPAATYRRRRAVAAAAVAAVVAALSLAVQSLPGGLRGRSLTGPVRPTAAGPVHVVRPGDTFWDIARMLRPGEDPRPLVTRLVAAHGGPVLLVGERISLPRA